MMETSGPTIFWNEGIKTARAAIVTISRTTYDSAHTHTLLTLFFTGSIDLIRFESAIGRRLYVPTNAFPESVGLLCFYFPSTTLFAFFAGRHTHLHAGHTMHQPLMKIV